MEAPSDQCEDEAEETFMNMQEDIGEIMKVFKKCSAGFPAVRSLIEEKRFISRKLDACEKKRAFMENKIKQLVLEKEDLVANVDSLQSRLGHYPSLISRLAALGKETTKLKTDLSKEMLKSQQATIDTQSQMKAKDGSIARLTSQLKMQQLAHAELKSRHAVLKSQFTDLAQRQTAVSSSDSNQIQYHQQRIATLLQEIAHLKGKLENKKRGKRPQKKKKSSAASRTKRKYKIGSKVSAEGASGSQVRKLKRSKLDLKER